MQDIVSYYFCFQNLSLIRFKINFFYLLSELESGDEIAKPSVRDARLFLLLASTSTISETRTTTTTAFTGFYILAWETGVALGSHS